MNHPLGDEDVEDVDALVAHILEYGLVGFPRYVRVAMAERGIDESDVRNVLRAGQCAGHRFAKGSWRYEICTQRYVVVVAFRSRDRLAIVTTWRVGDP